MITKEQLEEIIAKYNRGEDTGYTDEDEVWIDVLYRDITKDRYQVSNYGNIRRKDTLKPMSRNLGQNGYYYVRLSIDNGGSRLFSVHRIVAWHFCAGYNNETSNVVNHKDGKKTNNFYKNLEWCSQQHNCKHAFDVGLRLPKYGENTNRHTITNDIAHIICELLIKYRGSQVKVLDELKNMGLTYISYGLISSIKNKETWVYVSDLYFDQNYFEELHINDIELICNKILEHNGDVDKVYDDLRNMLPDISVRKITDLKNKERFADISDKFFKRGQFLKMRKGLFTIEDIHKICETLVKTKGDHNMTYNMLKDDIANITPDRVYDIKNKGSYSSISDEYFKQGELKIDRQIPTNDLDMIRSLLLTNTFSGSSVRIYEALNHDKYPKLTINVIKMIAGNHPGYMRSDMYDLTEFITHIQNRIYEPISKIILDRFMISYNNGNSDIDDASYDALLEEYLKAHGESNRPFLRQQQSDNVNDIVGTLSKVYLHPRENQKSYLDWLRVKNVDENTKIIAQPKFDGCSVAYDVTTDEYFTRGDYDNGESVNVTSLFRGYFKQEAFDLYKTQAVKCEAIMCHEVFKELGLDKTYKRPRDVVSATITSQNIDMAKYITLVPLRVYERGNLFVSDEVGNMSLFTTAHNRDGINEFVNSILEDGATVKFNDFTYSIDGVVVSTVDDEDSHINKEVAIKILNNVKETKLLRIEYQYGKTGKITPVGILEPVMFDNVTVDHVGLSTLSRVKEMNLRFNDTVRIVYNIVPYLIDSYHDGFQLIPIPTKCPICGADLNFKTLKTVRCTNPQCSGLKVGMIHRYCEKMKMMGIAKSTITKLYESGMVQCIGDLYRLTPETIMTLDGFKDKSATNICTSIWNASKNVPLDKWMGAMPIKDVSAKTWRLVINAKFHGDEMLAVNKYMNHIQNGTVDSFMMECIPDYVYGFSVNTYAMIKEGLTLYWDEIKDAIQFISFYTLTKPSNIPTKGRVTLTGTRDKELISALTVKGYEVADFSSKTIALVIPNKGYVSSKVVKARKLGIPIYTVEEAFEAL